MQHAYRNTLMLAGLTLLLLLPETSFASSTAGGGLPFDTWLTNVRNSITGPFAFTVAVISFVSAGVSLIFAQEISSFMRTLLYITLALSFVVAAQNMVSAITGKGAEITPLASMNKGGTP